MRKLLFIFILLFSVNVYSQDYIPSFDQGYAHNASECIPSAANLWDGKVGHWVPSLGVQGSTLFDVSGYGNDGTLTNMTSAAWVVGRNGYALDFDGTNDKVIMNDNATLEPHIGSSGVMTITAWIHTNSLTTAQAIVTKYNSSTGNRAYAFRVTSAGKIDFFGSDLSLSNGDTVISTNTISQTWTFVTLTFDASISGDITNKAKLYINGIQEIGVRGWSKGTFTQFSDTTAKLQIGDTDDPAPDIPFNGLINDVRLYNRILLDSEIWQLYTYPMADLRLVRRYYKAPAAVPPTGRRIIIISQYINNLINNDLSYLYN